MVNNRGKPLGIVKKNGKRVLKVIKRKNSQYYQIKDTILLATGQTIRVRETTRCTSYEDAKIFASKREREIIKELESNKTKIVTFNMATLDYVNSKSSLDRFHSARIERLVEFFDGISVEIINGKYFSEFVKKVIPKVKNETINRYRSDMVAILNFAKREQPHINLNSIPARKMDKPKPRYLSHDEAERLINAYHPVLRPLIILLAYQGCRIGEAIRLDWSDVDMDKRRITFWKTKNGDFRSVPMHTKVYESLRVINRERKGAVFLTPSGEPYTYRTNGNLGSPIKTAHTAALRRATIKQFKVHNWRSHWASRMVLDASANNYVLMALGGWKSPASVTHYINLNPDHLGKTLEKLL